MGRVFLRELEGQSYKCSTCRTALVLVSDLVSRSFNWRHGRAYLFNKNVVNVMLGSEEEKTTLTGLHTVQEVFCCNCGQNLGLKYVASHEKTQKNVEGKFVLERHAVSQDF